MIRLKSISSSILIGIMFCLSIFQCDRQSEYKELDAKVFVQVYCDVVMYADLVDSKMREAFVDSVLQSYQISREDFKHTVDSYSKDEKKWEKVFSKIVEELERREKELEGRKDSTKVFNHEDRQSMEETFPKVRNLRKDQLDPSKLY